MRVLDICNCFPRRLSGKEYKLMWKSDWPFTSSANTEPSSCGAEDSWTVFTLVSLSVIHIILEWLGYARMIPFGHDLKPSLATSFNNHLCSRSPKSDQMCAHQICTSRARCYSEGNHRDGSTGAQLSGGRLRSLWGLFTELLVVTVETSGLCTVCFMRKC